MADERESAIVVELPELDAVLDKHRYALDPSRRWGMPVHAFPQGPPSGGAFDEVIPHITIGEGGDVDLLRAAADAIRPLLPLRSRVTSPGLRRRRRGMR